MSQRIRKPGPTMPILATILWGVLLAFAAPATPAVAEEEEAAPSALERIRWQPGPSAAELGDVAEIKVPEGYNFAGAEDARTLLEAMGNPTSGREMGILVPVSGEWFVVFEFNEVGYVKDDEKDSLDAEAILKSIREGNEAANEERRKRGWSTLDIMGWERPPKYDENTHNLEWAIRGKSNDGLVVNYNTRLLGRGGVMEASLVVEPEHLVATLPAFKGLLGSYSYKSGHRYAEFKSGDKIAQYGLAALVAGGTAAAAAKSGLLSNLIAKLWKLIVVAAIAVASMFKKIFGFFRRDKGHASEAPHPIG